MASTPSTGVQIEALDPTADGRWDAYVEGHPDGLVFHHSGWLRALQREYGQAPVGLAAIGAGGELRGLLPLMTTRGLPLHRPGGNTGRRLSSLPRTPVAGPLADDRAVLAVLLQAAIRRTPARAQLQLKLLEPRLDGVVADVVGHPWRMSYVLDVPAAPEDLRFGSARNHASIKRAVNKAHRHGVRVRPAQSVQELRTWYGLYLETMRHHLVPARPFRLFRALWDELRPRGAMTLLLAEHEHEVLAGCVMLALGPRVFYAFNGVRRSALDVRPNDAIHWHAIQGACAEGRRTYDFGEVVERHAGLARFKAKWGTRQQRLHRYYFPAPAQPPAVGDASPQALQRAAARAWQAVPLRATAIAGDVAYRFL